MAVSLPLLLLLTNMTLLSISLTPPPSPTTETTTVASTASNDTELFMNSTSPVFVSHSRNSKAKSSQLHQQQQLRLLQQQQQQQQDEDTRFNHNLQLYAYGYVMLVICVGGVLGNVMALAVVSRKSMRCSSTAAYLRFLAAVDACVLMLVIFRYRSYHVLLSERDVIRIILDFDNYVQVYIVPFFWIFLGVSSFITMSLSLERYLVVRWPFTQQKSCRMGAVRGGTALAVLATFLVTLPHFLCYRIHRDNFRGLPVAAVVLDNRHLPSRAYLRAYNDYLLPIVWYMAPWVVLAIVNALLAWQVKKSSGIRVGVPNSLNPNRNLSLLIILIVGVYTVCHFPRCILEMYRLVNRMSGTDDADNNDSNKRALLVFNVIADVLNILNSCLNIVVYCFTGTRFRRELKQLLLCRSCCKNTATPAAPPTHHQSLHVSLREVPATPINIRKSFNMSCKELQLTRGDQPAQRQQEQQQQQHHDHNHDHRQHYHRSQHPSPPSSSVSSSSSPRGSNQADVLQLQLPLPLPLQHVRPSSDCAGAATSSSCRHSEASLVSLGECEASLASITSTSPKAAASCSSSPKKTPASAWRRITSYLIQQRRGPDKTITRAWMA